MSFPVYERQKDSGVKWLGLLPAHWNSGTLTRVADRVVVGIAEAATHAYSDTGVAILRSTNVRAGRIVGDILYITPEFAEGRGTKLINAGDLVTVRTGNAGVTAVVPKGLDGCQCFTMLITTLSDLGLPSFYCYVLNSLPSQRYFSLEGWGTAQVNISVPILKALPVAIPPLDEQRVIVTYLDGAIAKLDDLIEQQKRLIQLLNEEMQCLVLGSRSKKDTQELRLGNAADVMARPVVQREGEIYRPLGMYNRGRGVFHKEPREMADMGDSDFFWVRSGDLVISGQFAWEGAVGLAGEEEDGCVVSHRYPVLRAKEGIALTEYLFALLLTKHGDFVLNESSWGAAGRNRPLNLGLLLKERIWVPNMQTQMKVAHAVHQSKRLAAEMEIQLDLLHERRSALISAAVTGKIDVRDLAMRPEAVAA